MTINSYCGIVVRNEKDENLTVKFFFSLYSFIELDDAPYSNRHAVSILSVGNIKSRSATLDFASEKWEIHPVGCDKERCIEDAAYKRVEPLQLLL
jgi:hypothetical protein